MNKKELQIRIGKRIKEMREMKNISQIDLASACNFEKSNMNRIESGNTCPSIYTLYKIAQNLEIKMTEITDVED